MEIDVITSKTQFREIAGASRDAAARSVNTSQFAFGARHLAETHVRERAHYLAPFVRANKKGGAISASGGGRGGPIKCGYKKEEIPLPRPSQKLSQD
ncbi:hypothetical protein EVAR_59113_1 [Eumeta japonica]|uniref:Uncharacterized protein n=1 Tax=Eumeta variegata TaxID=151549 RepID=A0A4C1YWD6_EUMVA|nr:hypothetical protein EVAR_59113_1 [Eumeta japonica]